MSEQYFFVRKLGLGKEVVTLSLLVTDVSRGGGIEMMKTGGWFCKYLEKRILKGYYV